MPTLNNNVSYPFNQIGLSIGIFLFFFTITALVNLAFIYMPPVWDSFAVFSPAIYLYEHNFDFSGLLRQDGYGNGGPNIHSLSIISFFTYFFILIGKGDPAFFFPALHAMQFLFAGLVLTGTFFIASRLLGRLVGVLITFALLFYPLFLVQTGYLYTEIPGAALFMCAIYAWASRYLLSSVLLAALACMVKSFGIVLVCSLVFLLLLDATLPRRQRLMWTVTLILVMMGIELFKLSFSATGNTFERNEYIDYLISVFTKLNFVPDLKLLVTVALIMPFIFALRCRADYRINTIDAISQLVSGDISQRLLVSVYLVPFVFVGFIATIPLIGTEFFPLFRYYIWILPLLFIGAVYAFKLAFRYVYSNLTVASMNRVLAVLLTGLIFFFAANSDGRYYPSLDTRLSAFSFAERSYEYLDFYKIQHDSVVSLADLQNELPAFVTRGEYYFMSSPLMGYLKKKPGKIFLLANEPYKNSNLADFPDEFLLLDVPTRIFHGGEVVKQILAKARADSNYAVAELMHHQAGPYKSTIYHISKNKSPVISSHYDGANGFVSG